MTRKKFITFTVAAAVLGAGMIAPTLWGSLSEALAEAGTGGATATATINTPKDEGAIVAELFTSQGCSSCPPAQAFLGDLARRTDVVALELHVDYWDDLKTLFSGSWKDPWSSSVWTDRQTQYNKLIMNSDTVYTPQMIIDGQVQEAGARRSEINSLIEQAKILRHGKYALTTLVTREGHAVVTVEGAGIKKPVSVVLARLEKEAVNEVKGGENKGNKLVSHNIVKDMVTIGTWDGGKQAYTLNVSPFREGESCAVLLQDPDNMHILAGNLCGL